MEIRPGINGNPVIVQTGSFNVLPPLAKPLSALSPLEHALDAGDVQAMESLLKQGADPYSVCRSRLANAAAGAPTAQYCVRLIQVASRLKRMNLSASIRPVNSSPEIATSESTNTEKLRSSYRKRVFGRFAEIMSGPASVEKPHAIQSALLRYDLTAAALALNTPEKKSRFSALKFQENRLIGLLALDEREMLDRLYEHGMLETALRATHKPGLKTFLKQFPYLSDKSGRSVWRNNNCKVKFSDKNEEIVCHHLAAHWLMNRPLLENGKIDYSVFLDRKKLKQAFNAGNAHQYAYYLHNHCIENHRVNHDDWGKFLMMQFGAMHSINSDIAPKRMLIATINHAMACELKIKQGADGLPVYSMNFYDPNISGSHLRVRSQELTDFRFLSMAKLMNNPARMTSYFETRSHSQVYVMASDAPLSFARTQLK